MKTNLRKHEYALVGGFLLESFEIDFGVFNGKYTRYSQAYLDDFKAQLEVVKKLTSTTAAREKQKRKTSALYAKADQTHDYIKGLRGYFRHAKLDGKLLSDIINELKTRDLEEAIGKLKALEERIANNQESLEATGMPTGVSDSIRAFRTDLDGLKVEQNAEKNSKSQTTESNNSEYERLYEFMSEIMEDGKELFEDEAVKRGEYTLSTLIKRMRNENPDLEE